MRGLCFYKGEKEAAFKSGGVFWRPLIIAIVGAIVFCFLVSTGDALIYINFSEKVMFYGTPFVGIYLISFIVTLFIGSLRTNRAPRVVLIKQKEKLHSTISLFVF